MRQIIFRAKDIHTREWMEGYFGKDYAGVAYITALDGVSTATIDEATLGQFTGLLDKNGNKVFEGDRIITETGGIGYVVWDDAAFAIKSPGSGAVDWIPVSEYARLEVIGNIHEEREAHNG